MHLGTVIIGAGQAGAQAAASLRQMGYDLPITLIGDEPVAPYQRPPLSKAYLSSEMNRSDLFLRPDSFWEKFNIQLRTATRVTSLDLAKNEVQLDDGSLLGFSDLILATGTKARELPIAGNDLQHVYYLRSMADAENIKAAFAPGKKLVAIGAGYIGLECAATAIKQGMSVSVLEAQERILARVAGAELSQFFEQVHRKAGVQLRLNTMAQEFVGTETITAVVLQNGEKLPADIVVVGVGVLPNEELAKIAGIACNNGIIVDEFCRTSAESVYAVGDVCRHPSALYDGDLRLESVQNAIDQGKIAAAAICGKPKSYNSVPWFWSDQYDLKLQIAGIHIGHDEVIVRKLKADNSFAIFYLKSSVLLACDAINAPAEYMASRMLIGKKSKLDIEKLQNPEFPMKGFLT